MTNADYQPINSSKNTILINETLKWINISAPLCDYAFTLQTPYRMYGRSKRQIKLYKQKTESSVYYFLMQFNRLMTGNGWRRKEKYKPIFLPFIEGSKKITDKNLTLHVHASVGNLPQIATVESVAESVCLLWQKQEAGTSDTLVKIIEPGTESRWLSYTEKELKRYKDTNMFDFSNFQFPRK